MTPELLVVKIQTSGMLAVSGFNDGIDDTINGDGGDALSREFDEFDEIEDEEEYDDYGDL